MALLSELVAICEGHRVDTGATLSLFARRLREAGRISKAGRGRGAANMHFLDAARFLIGVASTDHPEKVADAEHTFSNTICAPTSQQSQIFRLEADVAPTLDVGLAIFLENLSSGAIDAANREEHMESEYAPFAPPPIFSLSVHRSLVKGILNVPGGWYVWDHPTLRAAISAGDFRSADPLLQALDRDTFRFRTGKNLTAELDHNLLRDVANLIGGTSADWLPPEFSRLGKA